MDAVTAKVNSVKQIGICGWPNVKSAYDWLQDNGNEPITIWGMRLGCLIVSEFIKQNPDVCFSVLFWQPMTMGKIFTRQLQRQCMISEMTARDSGFDLEKIFKEKELAEIGGYEIKRELFNAIETASLLNWGPNQKYIIIWKELSMSDKAKFNPVSMRVMQTWADQGSIIDAEMILGEPLLEYYGN